MMSVNENWSLEDLRALAAETGEEGTDYPAPINLDGPDHTVDQDSELEIQRLKVETMRAKLQGYTGDGPGAPPETFEPVSKVDLAAEFARSIPRGVYEGGKSLAEFVVEYLPAMSNMKANIPAMFSEKPSHPGLDAGKKILGDLKESDFLRGVDDVAQIGIGRKIPEQSPGTEAMLKGTEFGGSMILGPVRAGKIAQDVGELAKMGAYSAPGAAAGSYLSDGDPIAELVGGLATGTGLFGIPNFIKNSASSGRRMAGSDNQAVTDASQYLMEFADDWELAVETARRNLQSPEAIAAAEAGNPWTMAQASGDRGLAALEAQIVDENTRNLLYQAEQVAIHGRTNEIVPEVVGQTEPSALKQSAQNFKKRALGLVGKKTASELEADQLRTVEDMSALKEMQAEELVHKELDFGRQQSNLTEQAATKLEQTSLEALNEAAPSGYTITKTGEEGAAQLHKAVGDKFDEVWDTANTVNNGKLETQLDQMEDEIMGGLIGTDFFEKVVLPMKARLLEVSKYPAPGNLRSVDRLLRLQVEAAAKQGNMELKDSLQRYRNALADNIPGKRLVPGNPKPQTFTQRLGEAGTTYPIYLSWLNAAAKPKAMARGGPTNEELVTSGITVGGKKPTTIGKAPFADRTGKVELDKLTDAAEQNLVDARPDILKSIETVGEAERKAVLADQKINQAKIIAEGEKKKETVSKLPALALATDSAPTVAINNAMKSGDRKKSLHQLKAIVNKSTKKGKAEYKRGIHDYVITALSSGKKLNKKAIDDYDALIESVSDLYTKAELKRMRTAFTRSDELYALADLKKSKIPESAAGIAYYAASIMGLRAGKFLAGGNPLFGALLGKKIATDVAVKVPHERAVQKMREIMLDPQQYQKEITEMKRWADFTPDQLQKSIQKLFGSAKETIHALDENEGE